MWPFYKTYKIHYLHGLYTKKPMTTYLRATNMAHAVKKLQNKEWPSSISIVEIKTVEDK